MTISLDDAKNLAEEAVNALGRASMDQFWILHTRTTEVDGGWIFFYNSKEFIETGEPTSELGGNGPIFVDKSGVVHQLPSAVPWKQAIKNL